MLQQKDKDKDKELIIFELRIVKFAAVKNKIKHTNSRIELQSLASENLTIRP